MDFLEEVWFCSETRQYAVFRWYVDVPNEYVGPGAMIEAGSIRQAGDVWLFSRDRKVVCVGFRRSGKPLCRKRAPEQTAARTYTTKHEFDAACEALHCTVEQFAGSELEAA